MTRAVGTDGDPDRPRAAVHGDDGREVDDGDGPHLWQALLESASEALGAVGRIDVLDDDLGAGGPGRDGRDALGDDGKIRVTCEYCATVYALDPDEVVAEQI